MVFCWAVLAGSFCLDDEAGAFELYEGPLHRSSRVAGPFCNAPYAWERARPVMMRVLRETKEHELLRRW